MGKIYVYFVKRTEILEVDPDLMHPPGEWAAEYHAGAAVEAHALKLRPMKHQPDIVLSRWLDIELYLHSLPWLETLHTPIL